MAFRGTASLAFRATDALGFRAGSVLLKKTLPDPNAPTQIILRCLERDGAQTSHELWTRVQGEAAVGSKHRMKKMLAWLKSHQRVIAVPTDKTIKTAPFVYMLGIKPLIVPSKFSAGTLGTASP
mmetsp:Transcript_19410/g.46929  ORF Transcript_19410/g.46929 Transcript_19410/m.46929 type:complete len:124 (+) Transcript_19410:95-466(+)|eukprot:CAMPEP_0180171462 /NCGR_PEP_ID=MMETSP0986-20121125/34437_1 /TAXON_ID=697907 /ORGANISM="non described non described, Strain CCMP2293" /LENGTH=123 /DNA_ID=CAMNT_0022123349 /DNA_START=148 /DNA_END=519 /DNA_ORIENTATION=+